jgi:hypothetical protein
MSQFEGFGITNHVALRDEEAYAEFKTLVELFGGSLAPESLRDGRRLVMAYGNQEDGDFRQSVTAEELVESGYVSRHIDSALNATLPRYQALLNEAGYSGDEDNCLDGACDFMHEAYPLLAVGEVLIFQRVGHEKRHDVNGWAEAINCHGDRVSIALDEIYRKAVEAFGPPFNRSSY